MGEKFPNHIQERPRKNEVMEEPTTITQKPIYPYKRIIPSSKISLKGFIHIKGENNPASGYIVKIYAPKLSKMNQLIFQTITDQNGYWIAELYPSELTEKLTGLSNKSIFSQLRIEVYDIAGNKVKQYSIAKVSEMQKPVFIEISPPETVGLIKRDLYVTGRLTHKPEALTFQRLRVEVWDKYCYQEESLDESKVDKDGKFKIKITSNNAFGNFKTNPRLYLRVRDQQENHVLVYCKSPLFFDKNGYAVQDITIPANLSKPVSSFNVKKQLIKLQLALTPDNLRLLYLAGIKTMKDASDLKCEHVAKNTGIDLETLVLLNSFVNNLRIYHKAAYDMIEKKDIGYAFDRIFDLFPCNCPPPIEDTWVYRFTTFHDGPKKIEAAYQYAQLLGINPTWRNSYVHFVITNNRWFFDKFNIDVEELINLTQIDEPFAYNASSVETAIESLRFEINRRIEIIENTPIKNCRITLLTGPGSSHGTSDYVSYRAMDRYDRPLGSFIWDECLKPRGEIYRPNQRVTYILDHQNLIGDDGMSHCVDPEAINWGHYIPVIYKERGGDDWRIDDLRIEFQYEDIWITYIESLRERFDEYVWITNEEQGFFLHHLDDERRMWKVYLETCEAILDQISNRINQRRLNWCLDDILEPILEGNKYFILEDYKNAVKKYRGAEGKLNNIYEEDKDTDGYRRLQYILSLYIGECYWEHREYERAVDHFLKHTLYFRGTVESPGGTFDDHFLWNKISRCVLEWADHRYRSAGEDQQKLYDFGSVERVADPIDTDHPFTQTNSDGAHKLYSMVMNKCIIVRDNIPTHTQLNYSGNIENCFLLFDQLEGFDKNNFHPIHLRIGESQILEFSELDEKLGEKYKCQAALKAVEFNTIEMSQIHELSLLNWGKCDISFRGIRLIGADTKSAEIVEIFSDDKTDYNITPGNEIDLILAKLNSNCLIRYPISEFDLGDDINPADRSNLILTNFDFGPRCDLKPTDSACTTESDLLLLRAHTGMTSIESYLNPLGMLHDYVPVYRYNFLYDLAVNALSKAYVLGEKYVTYKRIIEDAMDNLNAAQQARDIAEENLRLQDDLIEISQSNMQIARERIDAIENQIDNIVDEMKDIADSGFTGSLTALLGGMLKSFNSKGGAGSVFSGFASSFMQVNAIQTNTQYKLNSYERKKGELLDNLNLAHLEAAKSILEYNVQLKRKNIAEMELDFLNEKLEAAQGENYRNPEIWFKIAEIQKRLFFSAMDRAIIACWRLQKAIEFEIEVGETPSPIEGIEWRPVRFDYLDQVVSEGVPDEDTDTIETSPLIVFPTAATRLEDDLKNLDEYHNIWYQYNMDHLLSTEIFFSDKFKLQLLQIQNAPSDNPVIRFTTDIKLFDSYHPGHLAYGRFFYVQCFYDCSSGANDFSGYLINAHEFEAQSRLVRSNVSFWRVPDNRETGNEPGYLDDWIDYSGSHEKWVLKSKPIAPTGSEDPITIYNITSPEYDYKPENFKNFLHTFENSGLQCDWTLYLFKSNPQVRWSALNEIILKAVWKASNNDELRRLYRAQCPLGIRGDVYIHRFSQTPEYELFSQLFDPHNMYTDQIGLPGNCINFSIAEEYLPGHNRSLQAIALIVVFDENVITQSEIPSLTASLMKEGIVNNDGQMIEITFITPNETVSESFEFPGEFLGVDPVGNWSFRMLASDNVDDQENPKSLHGLIDIMLVIEYNYEN